MIPKPSEVLARDREWAELVRCYESGAPELYLVLGRRRAGKSYLLTRFTHAVGGIYYQATKRTEKEQLAVLSGIVGERFGDPVLRRVAMPSWEELFSYLVEHAGGDPLVLTLDEFPYLLEAVPALASIVQSIWDHGLPETQVKLVLSGSHITAMKQLTQADQPLFGRRTGKIDVLPFGYAEAAGFAPGLPARDRLLLYGIFGGLPGYLRLIDPARGVAENTARHLLDPAGRLYEEGAHLFDPFLSDAGVHYSVVEAIAAGETRWTKIANRIGKQTSSLSRPLDWLLEMEVVKREAPVTEYPNPRPKRQRYTLLDPYLRFWYRFVSDIRARGLAAFNTPDELWKSVVEPRLDEYMGPLFEEMCRAFTGRSRSPKLPFRPVQVGSWWTEDGQEEVDVVALGPEGQVLLGECKWGKVGSHDLETLRRRGTRLVPDIKGAKDVTYALFSTRGYQDAAVEAAVARGEVLHFAAEDLFDFPGPPATPADAGEP